MSRKAIVQTQQAPTSHPLSQGSILQRKCSSCGQHKTGGGTCANCQSKNEAKPLHKLPTIQTKLTVGQPNDQYEQEADRVAEQIMRMPATATIGNAGTQFRPPTIQRMCATCENEEKLQTKEMPGSTPEVTPAIASRIQSLQGGGQPLSATTRNFFEPRFGQDFSHIRVSTDVQSTQALNAKAYTVGKNIVFNAGQYAPETTSGKRLLSHELTHTIQQNMATSSVKKAKTIQRTIGDGHDLTAQKFAGDVTLEAIFDDERLLRLGHRGPAVEKLQQALLDAGLSLPIHGVDGIFGSETKSAVEDFQRASGLSGSDIDGIVGPITMNLLDQRFAVRPAPSEEGGALTSGCQTIKTVSIDMVSLDGSNRDPVADLNFANTVFNQCCVRFNLGTGVQASATQTNTWLGGDTNLQRIHSCSNVHQEEKDLRENATATFGLSSRYKVFYVTSMTPSLRGVNFSPDCASGDRAPFNRHLYVSNSAARRTLAHELAHIPIVGLRDHTTHGDGTRNLMEPTNTATGEHLTAAQCIEVFNNI